MRSMQEVLDVFAYHPATPATAAKHATVRDLFLDTATRLFPLLPDGPEKTLALRGLQDAMFHANTAVALTAPADLSETRGVARVLPGDGWVTTGQLDIELAARDARTAEALRRGGAERAALDSALRANGGEKL